MNILIFIVVLALIALAALATVLSHKRTINSPQYKCLHSFKTIVARNGERSNEYLSTCEKCGLQRTHLCRGIN